MILYKVGEIDKHGVCFTLGTNLPSISLGKKDKNIFQENFRDIHIKLDTNIILHIGEIFRFFSFSILGFGIYCTIQTGY